MQFSVREAKAQFAHAANAAANGEKVVITKHGKPFVEIVAVQPSEPGDMWTRLAAARERLGIKDGDFDLDDKWLEHFNDPAFSRRVLGLEE